MSDTRCPCCGRDHETAHYAQPDINPRPNNPPPDELAQVRADIKRLAKREEELKALLLAHPDVRTGASWAAEVKTLRQSRTDLKEMRACHPDIVEQFTFPVEVTRIELLGVTEDGELISARQMRAAQETAQ